MGVSVYRLQGIRCGVINGRWKLRHGQNSKNRSLVRYAAPELLLDPLREFTRNRAYEIVSHKAKVRKSALGEDAPLIGAALLYRESATERVLLPA